MIELTDQQAQVLEQQSESPPRVRDPRTRQTYVLLDAALYERLRGLLGADFHPAEAYPAIDQTFAEGWNDPKMDDYDTYEERKP